MPKIVPHQERQSKLATAAAEIIAQRGIESVTIRAVAEQAGVSKGVVEHYFSGKSELLEAALDSVNQRYVERVQKATAKLRGLEALRVRMEQTLPLSAAIKDEWRVRLVFWLQASMDSKMGKIQAKRFAGAAEAFAQDLREAQADGALSAHMDCEHQAMHLLHSLTGIACAGLHSGSLYPRKRLQQLSSELIDALPQ